MFGVRLILVQDFNTRLPRVIYHQKAFETMDEMGPPKMHSFISRFHRRAIAFNYYEHDWLKSDEMKFFSLNASFIKFHSLGNSVTQVLSR